MRIVRSCPRLAQKEVAVILDDLHRLKPDGGLVQHIDARHVHGAIDMDKHTGRLVLDVTNRFGVGILLLGMSLRQGHALGFRRRCVGSLDGHAPALAKHHNRAYRHKRKRNGDSGGNPAPESKATEKSSPRRPSVLCHETTPLFSVREHGAQGVENQRKSDTNLAAI